MTEKHTDLIKDLIAMAYHGARKIITRGEEVMPVAFLYSETEDAVAPLPMPWANADQKASYFSALRKVCANPEVTAYAVITEAWMVSYDKDKLTSAEPMPSEHPRREECIQIVAQRRGEAVQMARAPITKGMDGKRQLGPCKMLDATGYEGRAVNFFKPPETSH